jgi:hypothetical protein
VQNKCSILIQAKHVVFAFSFDILLELQGLLGNFKEEASVHIDLIWLAHLISHYAAVQEQWDTACKVFDFILRVVS